MFPRSYSVLTGIVLGVTTASLAALPAGAQEEVSLDERIESQLGLLGSGLVAAVHHEGEFVLLKAWGSASHASDDTLGTHALFPFPGFTEVLLGATVRALHARGVLSADAPIGTYLPDLPGSLGRMTLDQLLRHTGGLDDAPAPPGAALQEIVDGLDPAMLFAQPGVIHSYSRYSFPLVAHALERVTGIPVEEVVSTALFVPLGMERSTFDRAEAERRGLAPGYRAVADSAASWTGAEAVERVNGLPVLYTTVPEIVRFLTAWMSGELATGPDALPGAPSLPPDLEPHFADGVWIGSYQILTELERTMRGMGHSVVVRAYPEMGSAVVAWMNGQGPPGAPGAALPWEVTAFVTERLIGPDFPVRVTEELPDSAAVGGADRLPLWAWAGTYRNGDQILVFREPETEGLEAELAFFTGERELSVERLEDGSVLARIPETEAPAARFRFVRDAQGTRYVFLTGKAYVLVEG